MYVIVAPIKIKPEHKEAFIESMLDDAVGSVSNEPGCLRFNVIQDEEDPDKIYLRPLRGGRSSGNLAIRVTNIQANDEDSRKDEYLTECSLEFRNEKAHALLTGVTG